MKFHKLHWYCLYAVILFSCITWIGIDIKNEMNRIFQRKNEEKTLWTQVESHKKSIMDVMKNSQSFVLKTESAVLDTSTIMTYLVHLLKAQHIQINKIQLLKVKSVDSVNVMPIKINAEGDFIELSRFMLSLLKGSQPMMLTDFSLKQDNNGSMTAEMALLLVAIPVPTSQFNHEEHRSLDENH